MIDVEAVQAELSGWIVNMQPDAVCAVIFKAPEIATFYLMTAQVQAMFEEAGADPSAVEALGSMRAKVRAVLEQAGYGQPQEPQNGPESDEDAPVKGDTQGGEGERAADDESEPETG